MIRRRKKVFSYVNVTCNRKFLYHRYVNCKIKKQHSCTANVIECLGTEPPDKKKEFSKII